MKKTEFRNLINECVREVLAEEKAKKKQLAKKKIEEIINEAELSSEDLNELFGLGGGKQGDPAEITKLFPNDEALAKGLYNFYGQKFDEKQKEIALSNLKDEKKKKKLIQGLANLGLAVGYDNIKNYGLGSKFKNKKGEEIKLTPAYLGDTLKFPQFGAIISAATKASGEGGSGTNFGE